MSRRSSSRPAPTPERNLGVPSARILEGRTALIAGAGFGIGRAIAHVFANHGARIVVHCLSDRSAAEVVASEITANGGEAIVCQADVSSEREVRRMFTVARGRFGGPDVVVTTPQSLPHARPDVLAAEDRVAQFDKGLIGEYLCPLAAIRHFKHRRDAMRGPQEASGRIIFVSVPESVARTGGSMNHERPERLQMMTKCIAQEAERDRICINCVTATQIADAVGRRRSYQRRRRGPDNVAEAALWLASDQSGLITGITVFVSSATATDSR